MATKKEVWLDKGGRMCTSEVDALTEDYDVAMHEVLYFDNEGGHVDQLTPDMVAAIDALHEYAHRGGAKAPDTQRDADRGTVLPEGVPPELDDWVKRWEWITARVSVDAIKKLCHDDEVRISTRWFIVWGTDGDYITLVQPAGTALLATDLAAIANEVRYNDR